MSENKQEPAVIATSEQIAFEALKVSAASGVRSESPSEIRKMLMDTWNNDLSRRMVTPSSFERFYPIALAVYSPSILAVHLLPNRDDRVQLSALAQNASAAMNALLNPQRSASDNYISAIYASARDRAYSQRCQGMR